MEKCRHYIRVFENLLTWHTPHPTEYVDKHVLLFNSLLFDSLNIRLDIWVGSYYLCCHLVSGEDIVLLGVTLCVCPPSRLYHVLTACCISLGGKSNVLYPVLTSLQLLATFPPDGRERSPVDNGLGRDARPIRQQRRRR